MSGQMAALVLDHLTGVSSSGSGFFLLTKSEHFCRGCRWGHVDMSIRS